MKFTRRTVLKSGVLLPLACSHLSQNSRIEEEEIEPMSLLEDIRPQTLRSGSVVNANSDAEVSAGPMTNGSGEPMEIHEFIFSVKPTDAAIAAIGSSGLYPSGGQFAVGLTVKDGSDFGYALTNGVIPLWSFGQARQLGQEEVLNSLSRIFDVEAETAYFQIGVYAWKLDHPLYLPPGARIIPVVRSLGGFNGDVEFGITAIGKILPSAPTKGSYKMPWVCSYLSKSFNLTEGGNDSSPDNALYNPFDRDVTIERFVGRFHIYTAFDFTLDAVTYNQSTVMDVSSFDPTILDPSLLAVTETGNNYYSRVMSLRMRDSVGNPLVRESTLFRSVFESATRTWEARHVLPAKQYHKVDIYKTEDTRATSTLTTRIQTSVSSVGWREVSWRKS